MPARRVTTRTALTVAGAAVALVLAALLALVVNFGILRAAGSPSGPGRLSSTSVEREVPASTTRPERHHSRPHEDRATPSPGIVWTPWPTQPSSAPYVGPSPTPSASPNDGSQREREFGSHADD
jgi:hypothetical protein